MAKGPIVTPEVEALIASVYHEHPKWKAPPVRNEVEALLRKQNRNSPKGWPSLSTVQKTLATVRRNIKEPSREDMLWCMGTLNEYPVSPEFIPYVLDVWKLRVARGETFTIREAKWVARLSGFELQGLIITKEWSLDNIKSLSHTAGDYARLELLFELLGYPIFCSHYLDKMIMGIPVNVPICPKCEINWNPLDTLALEGGHRFRQACEYLKSRKYKELSRIGKQIISEELEELPKPDWMCEEEQDWEEYKKEV
ncbi:MAG TPA: hypothetical protein VMW50_07520 [Dehalococcoidia bacterium]|nr:hypothetical protein [Dehalococcoidia bacterium]